MEQFGVHSEVGRRRKVMVHRPGLELRRLTPSNHDELLFDDVVWVERAQQQHDAFVAIMREQGVEVFYHEQLLAEALADPARPGLSRAGRLCAAIASGRAPGCPP
jgi:arginine deiminase